MDNITFSSFVKSQQSASDKLRQLQRHRLAARARRADHSAQAAKARRYLSGRLGGLKGSRLGVRASLSAKALPRRDLFSLKYFGGTHSFFSKKLQGLNFLGFGSESKDGTNASRLAFDPCESCGGRVDTLGYIYCSKCRNTDDDEDEEGSFSRVFNFLAQGGSLTTQFGVRKRFNVPAVALQSGQCSLWLKYRRLQRAYINDLDAYCRRIASDAKNIKMKRMTLENMIAPITHYFKPQRPRTDSDDEIESVVCDDEDEDEGEGGADANIKNRQFGTSVHTPPRTRAGDDNLDDDLEIVLPPSPVQSNKSSSEQSSQQETNTSGRRSSLNSLLKFMSLRRDSPQSERMSHILKAYESKHEQLESRLRMIPESEPISVLPQEHDPDYDVWGLRRRGFETYNYINILFKNKSHKYNSFDLITDFSEISNLMYNGLEDEVLTEQFGITITRSTLECLCGSNWLNDEVINYYMNMIQKRNEYFLENKVENVPNCFCFNTFFFSALCGFDKPQTEYNYKAVARWTARKGINVFNKDILLIPVHLNKIHWVLGVVDMRPKWRRILLLDSLGGNCPLWFNNIKRWLQDEHLDKQKTPLDVDEWECCIIVDSADLQIPRQENGHDCGVFICLYAECVAAARAFDFTQTDIANFRIKMIKQILQGSIYDPPPPSMPVDATNGNC